MSEPALIALIVATPPTVAAVGGIIIGILADRKASKKLDHITILTNSTLTTANKRIAELEDVVTRLVAERGEGT
jgi:hypothetical protein